MCGHNASYICREFPSPVRAAGERPEFDIKPHIGASLKIFPRGHFLKSFPQRDTLTIQLDCEISVFPLLGELPKAIEHHMHVCQSYRWQLGPNMWSSPTTKSLDPIVVTTLRWPSQGKPRICHRLICLQLSGARNVDNGCIRASKYLPISTTVTKETHWWRGEDVNVV